MIKKLTLFIIAVCLASCNNIDYDGETRLVIEGNLRDETGAALANQQMEIIIQERNYEDQYTDQDQISYGSSDANGNFQFVIPAPKGDNNFVDINVYINNGNSVYQFKGVRAIRKSNFTNYKYSLKDLTIYKNDAIADLTIQLNPATDNRVLTALDIDGIRADTYIDINPLPEDDTPGFDYENIFKVAKNQTVTLNYTVTDYSNPGTPVSTNFSEPIVVTTANVNYILNY